jgi:dynein heavy chain, axonemal
MIVMMVVLLMTTIDSRHPLDPTSDLPISADAASCRVQQSVPEHYTLPTKFLRLWLHECTRVFSDRLISPTEISRCKEIFLDVAKRVFTEENPDVLFAPPLTFTNFVTFNLDDTPVYAPVASMAELKGALERKLGEYNETNAIMDLVLFEDAIEHVCRVARIIGFPRGNALLVGVGGSGKQSLSKLASFICEYDVVQISVTSDYGLSELKEEIKDMYKKAGVKPGEPLVFILTDSQIVDERFLVFINDLLSSGVIPDLFASDELDAIVNQLRGAAKSAGIPDTRDSILDFFIDRVRNNLHVILCFSPVGNLFRTRARRFPALINCTAIDWFQEWPKAALINVAQRFLNDVECAPEVKENVSHHVAEVHLAVNAISADYFQRERRYNYTTPRSFLELINFFKAMLAFKRAGMHRNIGRLSSGLVTLQKTNRDVEGLKEDLKIKMRAVEAKKAATDELLVEMGIKRGEAEAQQAIADIERQKADAAAQQAREIEEQAAGDLLVAKPALDRAQDAVNCLDKASMTELKTFTKPPAGVDKVTAALLIMMRGEKKNFSWENAKKMMAKVDAFKEELENYRGEDIPDDIANRVSPMLDDEEFTYDKMKSKSSAAANLCNWVVNIIAFNKIYKKVKPLMDALEQARATKAQAETDLAAIMAIVAEVEHNLSKLQVRHTPFAYNMRDKVIWCGYIWPLSPRHLSKLQVRHTSLAYVCATKSLGVDIWPSSPRSNTTSASYRCDTPVLLTNMQLMYARPSHKQP